MTSHLLLSRPATTPAMQACFDDASIVSDALAFESALADAQAKEGIISKADAVAIADACRLLDIDAAELADEAAFAGTLAIPIVARIRAALPKDIAGLVHKGATSQDLADTVSMMQAKRATALLEIDLDRILAALAKLGASYAATPAIGRTLMQDAMPISFGLRVAQWHRGISDASQRLRAEVKANARIQLGGAAGTRAGLQGCGGAIAQRVADALGLLPGPPWHSRRVGTAGMASALAITIGALAKMARDISLLSQNAIGEAREPWTSGRGGSSAMAHKRNPTGCQVALSASVRAPGLVAAVLSAMDAEEERGLGGWQAEIPMLAELFQLAGGSAAAMSTVAGGLEVDEAALARNLAEAKLGMDIGESPQIVAELLESREEP